MDERLKILPMVALAALALLTVKVVDLWSGWQAGLLGITPAEAGGGEKPTKDEAHKDDHGQDHGEDHGGDAAAKPDKEPVVIEHTPGLGYADFREGRDPALISESEVRVLESLAERRAQIDAREKDVAMQLSLLQATEKRVQERIDELKRMEQRLKDLLGQRDEEAEAQIASLVKVYENMKAKDAARIFENLERSILLSVAGRMKEAKIAAILAQMRPESAQALTVMLAQRFTQMEAALDG